MKSLRGAVQTFTAIAGAVIIGNELNNTMIGIGIFFITHSIMPFIPNSK